MQCNMFPHSNSHPQLKPIETTASDGRACDHRPAFAQQYPNPQISKPRAGLRLFSQGFRQHVLMRREVDHQPLQSAVLFFQLPQPPQARSPPDARTSSSRRKVYPAMPSCRQKSLRGGDVMFVLERFFISAEPQSRQKQELIRASLV
jgi:hypothetical protein